MSANSHSLCVWPLLLSVALGSGNELVHLDSMFLTVKEGNEYIHFKLETKSYVWLPISLSLVLGRQMLISRPTLSSKTVRKQQNQQQNSKDRTGVKLA